MKNQMIRKLLISVPGLAWAGTASADLALNMPKGVTALSAETYEIHMLAFWWCVAIGVVVFGAMIYSLFAHRKSRGAKAADFSHSAQTAHQTPPWAGTQNSLYFPFSVESGVDWAYP